MLCPYMVFTRYRRTLIKWFAWGMTSNNNVLKFQSKTELKFTKSSLKIIPVCTLGLVKYYVLNTIFFMIKDLVWSRVIIFHVFIAAVITTAAANDDTMKITDNRHWTLPGYLALYMDYFTEEIFDAHSNPRRKVPLQSHFHKWRGWDSLPKATSLTY